MSGVNDSGSPRRRRWRIVALVTFLLVAVTSPVTLLGLAFWAADGSWEFAGGGFRHWVFVKGSTVDRLGFVAATGEPARYVVRLGEGRGRRRRLRRALQGTGYRGQEASGVGRRGRGEARVRGRSRCRLGRRCLGDCRARRRGLEHGGAHHSWSRPHGDVQLLAQPDNVSWNACAEDLIGPQLLRRDVR